MNGETSAPRAAQAHRVHCRMQAEEAAMERLLQVVRIRGFQLQDLQVEREGQGFDIALTVTGERPIDFLLPQLEKLHTVDSVVTTQAAVKAENRGSHQGRTEATLKTA